MDGCLGANDGLKAHSGLHGNKLYAFRLLIRHTTCNQAPHLTPLSAGFMTKFCKRLADSKQKNTADLCRKTDTGEDFTWLGEEHLEQVRGGGP